MIHRNDKDIIAVYLYDKVITTIYHGARIVWQLANSCFGSGFWINSKQWSNTDGWRNI